MAVVNPLCSIGIALDIETENHLGDLTPVGASLGGIEKREIGHKMALIIGADAIGLRWFIVKWGYLHCASSRLSGNVAKGRTVPVVTIPSYPRP